MLKEIENITELLSRIPFSKILLLSCFSSYGNPFQVGSIRIDVKRYYAKEVEKEAAATNDTVIYEYSLVNNGLLSLYNISIHDSVLKKHGTVITCTDVDAGKSVVVGSTPGELNGLASYPNNGLAPAAKLTCSGEDSVTQEEVRYARCLKPRNVTLALSGLAHFGGHLFCFCRMYTVK